MTLMCYLILVLLMSEIQLQQMAAQGKLFHIVMLMEGKTEEPLFENQEQWNYNLDHVTTGNVWVTNQENDVKRVLYGSKHSENGLRLFRQAFKSNLFSEFNFA